MTLKGDLNGVGATVTVLRDDEVGHSCPRVVAFSESLTVQEDNDVGVLLE
jgi:hypothetical protein